MYSSNDMSNFKGGNDKEGGNKKTSTTKKKP